MLCVDKRLPMGGYLLIDYYLMCRRYSLLPRLLPCTSR